MALAWGTGLAAVVAAGYLGSALPGGSSAAPPALPEAVTPVAESAPDPGGLVQVRIPSGPDAVITTSHLMVGGTRTVAAGELRVVLESSAGGPVASVTLAQAPGSGPFLVDFPFPDPRPEGPMVVQVVALTPTGTEVEVARIPVTVGPLQPTVPRTTWTAATVIPDRRLPRLGPVEVGAPRLVGNGRLGDDGIVGGIVFGNAWDPEALAP